MSTITPPIIAYKANCHCSAVTLTVRLPSLSTLELSNCNCSLCTRNGYVMAYPTSENVEYHTGADNLTEFRFASENGAHRFCKTCGISISAELTISGKVRLAVNIRLFQDVDLSTMKYKHTATKDYGGNCEYPDFPRDLGITPFDPSLVPYHDTCQCKAVTYTAYLPSLSETGPAQCNCSVCTTNGYILAYSKVPVVVCHSGQDSVVTYTFATHKAAHKFCKSCGSSICVDRLGLGTIDYGMNMRMFKEIDLKGLEYTSFDGRNVL
ncbi:hypothetical protein FIBSPDRAFT_1048163 [Athelia psychrophila]|uniref:CENP-V/GFA domain-containing protein n=1 Tax=Athelia psychrophila TaxID=1759441 RepID=A0A166E3Z5_9AGAM|nr:hypothetical protein FIBSPDRAFT_1048163 [Fibularhizoctonia sp. CBS 109695]